MFDKRHRITLLFNANKAYDRQVVEGVGEYLQASQSEWDIFIEEDFRARIDNIKDWLGDGVIADYDDDDIAQLLADVNVPIIGVGGSLPSGARLSAGTLYCHRQPRAGRKRFPASEREGSQPLCILRPALLKW